MGAVAAAALCSELELLERDRDLHRGLELLTRLEAELRLIEEELGRTLAVGP
jgi:hypothetical protein